MTRMEHGVRATAGGGYEFVLYRWPLAARTLLVVAAVAAYLRLAGARERLLRAAWRRVEESGVVPLPRDVAALLAPELVELTSDD